MKFRIVAFILFAFLAGCEHCPAQTTNRTPLNRPFLQTDLDGNGHVITNVNVIMGIPLIPPGAVYTNNATLGVATYQVDVTPGRVYYAVVTNENNYVTDAEFVNITTSPGAAISTPDSVLYAYDNGTDLLGQPVQEQIYLITTNIGFYVGQFNGIFSGLISPDAGLPPNVVTNNGPATITWTSGQLQFTANVAGNANNSTDDGIVVQNANRKKWNTTKFLFWNGSQAGAIGIGNDQSGTGADVGNATNTYYTLIGFFEGPGFFYVQNEKIMGGWIHNLGDQSGDFVQFYWSDGTGFNSNPNNNIAAITNNIYFRLQQSTGNIYANTNLHGSLFFGTPPTFMKTNAAPSNVTIGTTAPDLWIPMTNNGVQYFWPVWKNH